MPQPAAALPSPDEREPSPATLDESSTGRWVVRLEDPSLARYTGGIPGLAATSPRVTGDEQLDVAEPASVAYLDYLADQQADLLTSMEEALDRPPEVAFEYRNALNAVAVEASAAEAAELAALPGVTGVFPDNLREIETDVSHDLIGSASFWNGETGPGAATRGEGVLVGMIDTGVNAFHPAFAEVAGDGYQHQNPYGSGNFVGVCDPSHPDHQAVCNDKLVGAWNFNPTGPNFPSVLDWDNHGSHTGSTMAGNVHEATFTLGQTEFTRTIQGVAPRANVISYLVCDPQCPDTSSIAAVDQAIEDGVDVLNYSISGTDDPWNDPVDLAFLDAFEAGIFISASAGNDGPNSVAKTGPWNASVAASTHERIFAHTVDVTGPTAPPELTGMPAAPGDGPQVDADIAGEIRFDETNPTGCTPFASGTFEGSIALIQRGGCEFGVKVNNADAAGAMAVVIFNQFGGPPTAPGGLGPNDHNTQIPAVMLERRTGDPLRDLILANAPAATEARINLDVQMFIDPDAWEDVMAGFSSTGPSQFELLAPTFTAPGVNILAAASAVGDDPEQYTLLQGTSMSSPHGAGSGALLAALQPDWSPAQVRSALASTADPEGILAPDGDTAATEFNYGSGRLDLAAAARVGLVMDETAANFEAANPAFGGDPKTLNLPSMIDHSCAECSWQRTVTSVADTDASYTAVVDAPDGMEVTVTPAEFTIAAGATTEIQIEVDATGLPEDEWAFADVRLETSDAHAGGEPIASVHYPVGVIATSEVPELTLDPEELTSVQGPDQTVTQQLTIGNTGDGLLDWEIVTGAPAAAEDPTDVASRPATGLGATLGSAGQALAAFGAAIGSVDGEPTFAYPSAPGEAAAGPPAPEDDATTQAGAVIWDQPSNGTEGIVSDVFNQLGGGVYSADDFTLTGDTTVELIHAEGFWNSGSLAEATDISWYIYPEEGGVPAGHPEDGQDAHVWTHTAAPTGSGVDITDNNITLDLVTGAGGGLDLAAGTYWLTAVPHINAASVAGETRWNWRQGNPQGAQAHLVDPTDLFGAGATDWTPFGSLGLAFTGTAFRIEGTVEAGECEQVDVPWLSVAPGSGSTAAGETTEVEVTFDSTGRAAGDKLSASLCLETNDPARPLETVPVTMEVEQAQNPAIEVTPDSLSAEQPPGAVTDQPLTIGNTGDGVLDWEVAEATPGGSVLSDILYENGPFVTHPGAGPGGSDHSVLQSTSLGMDTLGGNVSVAGDGRMADQFTVDADGWDVETLTFYAYQTGSSTSSTFTGVNYQIWDGPPSDPDSTVVFGDTTTNQLLETGWTNAYRVSETTVDTNRPIMEVVAGAGFTLPEGTYWVDWQLDGTLASGPWMPPITILGETTTGDALQFFEGTWDPFLDSVTLTGQGAPFTVAGLLSGAEGCDAPSDVPWLSVAPASGSTAAGDASEVTVSFDSTGLAEGDYQALLCVDSNDQQTPRVEVPVTLTVADSAVICDQTVTGVHDGPLTVTEGTTCLAAGARVLGEVNVLEGAGLVASAASIQGPVSAIGATVVDVAFSQITGPVQISGGTETVSLFGTQVTGSVSLVNNQTGETAITVSANTIIGSLSCFGNQPAPTSHGLTNTATAGKFGQCAEL